MTKDTYSSKLKNYLTPIYNVVTLIDMYKKNKINDETFIDLIVNSNIDIAFKKISKLSLDDKLNIEYEG